MAFKLANNCPVVQHSKLSDTAVACCVKGTGFEMIIEDPINVWEAKLECLRAWLESES